VFADEPFREPDNIDDSQPFHPRSIRLNQQRGNGSGRCACFPLSAFAKG
jgi:hypothetical protein